MRWSPDQPGYGVALGQYAFALEETGDYAAAESHARLGLEISPEDCWSLHCLAHVYEMQSRQDDALGLLRATQAVWREQNLLSGHIWWHLALRLVEAGRFGEALEIFDETLGEVEADNPFRLTDGTSLLWRLELAGCSVGDRWRAILLGDPVRKAVTRVLRAQTVGAPLRYLAQYDMNRSTDACRQRFLARVQAEMERFG